MRIAIGTASLAIAGTCAACFGGDDAAPPRDASTPDGGADARVQVEPEVVVGVPAEDGSLDFAPLGPGGDIALQTFGQGGTHASLAVRCIGFGKRAFVVVTLENLVSGAMVMTPEPVRPQLLLCRDPAETICDLIPLLVLTGGLAEPSEKDGLHIRVTAEVHNEAGVEGHASTEGFLRAQ